mmetsp:Transcript_78251/g.253447  ORF Transcript_78251/g.253447 Transcript_78251/m.253447 type:complete len:530 (-) Transcript_78251:265-1854(-)
MAKRVGWQAAHGFAPQLTFLLTSGAIVRTVLCVPEASRQASARAHKWQTAPGAKLLALPALDGLPAAVASPEEFDPARGLAKAHAAGTLQAQSDGVVASRRRRRAVRPNAARASAALLADFSATVQAPVSRGGATAASSRNFLGMELGTRRSQKSAPSRGLHMVAVDRDTLAGASPAEQLISEAHAGGAFHAELNSSTWWRPAISRSSAFLQLHTGARHIHPAWLALIVLASVLAVAVAALALYSRSEAAAGQQLGDLPKSVKAQGAERGGSMVALPRGSLPELLTSRSAAGPPLGCGGKSPAWQRSASSFSLPPLHSTGPSPRSPAPFRHTLCPDLVVPERMEFVFAVREVLTTGRQQLSFSIVDMRGQPLSHIIVNESGSAQCGVHLQMLDGTPLAWVRTELMHDRPSGRQDARRAELERRGCLLEICRPSGELFCTMTKDDSVPCHRYVLRGLAWQQLYTYYGNFREKAVNVTNPSGQLACTSERCLVDFDSAPHYQVRVAPQTDAGLLLCGLLSIDKLEGGSYPR